MGFIVESDGLVVVDHSTHSFCNTSIFGNPTEVSTRCKQHPMKVYSILLRRKVDSVKVERGDNCPLIYAMKRKHGLYVTRDSIGDLCSNIYSIMSKFSKDRVVEGNVYDFIIPMPSSHKISFYLAKKISEFFVGSSVRNDFFRKASVDEILHQVNSNKSMPRGAKVSIVNTISSAIERKVSFSIGELNTNYRGYVDPLIFNGGDFVGKRVLLVDDLFATGATIISAKNHIRSIGGVVKVDALCLFSPLNGRIRR